MIRNISLTNGCRLRQLSEHDIGTVQKLCEQCPDYFLLHEGAPVPATAAAEIFSALPPGKTQKDKFVFGVERPDGTLAGIVDLVRDFPEKGVWMLGLMLLTPEERGKGTGRTAHGALAQWAKALGAKLLRIGVVEENEGGALFWDALGYRKQKETVLELGTKTHTVNILTLQV